MNTTPVTTGCVIKVPKSFLINPDCQEDTVGAKTLVQVVMERVNFDLAIEEDLAPFKNMNIDTEVLEMALNMSLKGNLCNVVAGFRSGDNRQFKHDIQITTDETDWILAWDVELT